MVFFRNLTISGSPPLKSVLPLIADSGQNNSQSPTSQSSISISTDEKTSLTRGRGVRYRKTTKSLVMKIYREGLPEALGCLKIYILLSRDNSLHVLCLCLCLLTTIKAHKSLGPLFQLFQCVLQMFPFCQKIDR